MVVKYMSFQPLIRHTHFASTMQACLHFTAHSCASIGARAVKFELLMKGSFGRDSCGRNPCYDCDSGAEHLEKARVIDFFARFFTDQLLALCS